MRRDELVRWLDETLGTDEIPDPSLNGLQVEGAAEVHKLAVAVDASMTTFEQAAEIGADMLVTHHGLFWGGNRPVVGSHYRRLRTAIIGNLGIYSSHLPLDGR